MGSRNSGKKPDFKAGSDSSPPRLLRPRSICPKCHCPVVVSCVCTSSHTPSQEGKVRTSASPVSSESSSNVAPIFAKKKKRTVTGKPLQSKSRSPPSRRQLFRDDCSSSAGGANETLTTSTSVENVSGDFTETSSLSSSSELSCESSSSLVVEEDIASSSTSFEPIPSTSTADLQAGKSKRKKKKMKVLGRHVCRVCSKIFGSPGKLSQHMFSHTGEKPFECDKCLKAFSSKFKLVRHLLIHSDERQYHCTMCDRTFHRKDHLKNHFKVHSPVKKTFPCDKAGCLKVYSSLLSYRKHAAVHAAEEGDLDCKMCGKSFVTKDEIVYHLKVHAGSRTVKNPSDKKYRCEFCDRRFFTRKDVRRHLVVHTGKRDFLCQYCPHRFGRKDHLVRHIKKSHSNVSNVMGLRVTMSKGKRLRSSMNSDATCVSNATNSISSSKQRSLARSVGKPKPSVTSDSQTNILQTEPNNDSSPSDVSGVVIVVDESTFTVDVKPSKEELPLVQLKVEDLMTDGDCTFNSDIKIEDCAMIPDLQPIMYSQQPPTFPEHIPVSLPIDSADGPIKSETSLSSLPVEMDMNQFMSGFLGPSNDTAVESEAIENEDNRTSVSSETQSATGMSDAEATEFLAHFSNDDEIMQLMELSMPITNNSPSSSMDGSAQTTTLPRFNQAFQQQPP